MPKTHDSKPHRWHRGAVTVELDACYWARQSYPPRRTWHEIGSPPPLSERVTSREIEEPWRTGHGRAFRFPLTRWAIVIGHWGAGDWHVLEEEEEGKLVEAMGGLGIIPGITATEIEDWARGVQPPWWRRLAGWLYDVIARRSAGASWHDAIWPPPPPSAEELDAALQVRAMTEGEAVG